ncbi:MAG: efflux RND transporter periplasmic adaptor subunit [Oscillospiraceae bacterium]|nr:efflux RND transporter periplasmic adaptor subunit [Oscillospiraceae bacterium]
MGKSKGIIKGVVITAAVCGLGAGGWFLSKNLGGTVTNRSEKVYVQKVSTLNTVDGANLFSTKFAGVIVAQKTVDVKYDTSKIVDEILVSNDDMVKKGDKLLTYNVESIQLDIESARLEVERMENEIETNNLEIKSLEAERRTAAGDAQVSYTTKILSLQSSNARNEYDIKTKNVEITKLENTLNNAFVTAPIDGTIKNLKENDSNDIYAENADVLLQISAEGDYRVKGVFNEQNSGQIYQGAKVFLHSRLDDTSIRGEIDEIDTTPQTNDSFNMYDYGMNDEQTTSSKYAFYVKPDHLEGFMLGQHILIEMDNGQEDEDHKEGLWIYSNFVLWDGNKNYVWAKNSRDQIEKRYVEIGEVDDVYGDCQILSGLDVEDYIAYPSEYIEAGMTTTTNQSDKDIPENEIGAMDSMNGGMMTDDMFMDEMYDEEGSLIEGEEIPSDEDGTEEDLYTEDNFPTEDPIQPKEETAE